MQKQRLWGYAKVSVVVLSIVIAGAGTAFAQSSSSSHYQITETQFGSGSSAQTCSASYCSRTSIGDLTAGQSKSVGGTASFGSITPDEPSLEVIVQPGISDLGNLTAEETASKTTVVKVRSYLSNGYMMQIVGDPPKVAGHTLSAITSDNVSSTPGVEQFGINLTANSSPSIGALPVQVPDAQTSFGVVNSGYSTPNKFKYINGDVVAHSATESGQTEYTISTIVNISNQTPAGHYTGDFSAVVIPSY